MSVHKGMENPNDRRQKSVDITKKGLKLLDNMFSCEQKADTLLNNLSFEEVTQLNYLLNKIREKERIMHLAVIENMRVIAI